MTKRQEEIEALEAILTNHRSWMARYSGEIEERYGIALRRLLARLEAAPTERLSVGTGYEGVLTVADVKASYTEAIERHFGRSHRGGTGYPFEDLLMDECARRAREPEAAPAGILETLAEVMREGEELTSGVLRDGWMAACYEVQRRLPVTNAEAAPSAPTSLHTGERLQGGDHDGTS
jgi:hypothetical protein